VFFDKAQKEVCGLFWHLVSISECITPNVRKTDAWWTGVYVEGSSLGLIAVLSRHLPAGTEGEPLKRQAGWPASWQNSNATPLCTLNESAPPSFRVLCHSYFTIYPAIRYNVVKPVYSVVMLRCVFVHEQQFFLTMLIYFTSGGIYILP
jgi:hypothetical protein